MKKGFILLLLILFSCQKDEIIIEPTPIQEMIFDLSDVMVQDGQDILFEVLTNEPHQLIISTQYGSVLTKESFQTEVGTNTRQLYTKILPKETLILTLQSETETIGETTIIVK
jgi:hypothetical protein